MTRVPKRVHLVIDRHGEGRAFRTPLMAGATAKAWDEEESRDAPHTVHTYQLVEPTPKPRGKAKGRRS
jgi:hypothetical protein